VFFVLPKLAADVIYLSLVVKWRASVNMLVPRWFPALIKHSYVDPSFKPVMRRLVAFVSFLYGVREPTCFQKTLKRIDLASESSMCGWSHYNIYLSNVQQQWHTQTIVISVRFEVFASVFSQRFSSGIWCSINGIPAFQGNVVATSRTVKVPKTFLGYLDPMLP